MESSSAPKTPGRNSDIDFNDVFGGPPRRSSIQERRYSLGESSAFRRSEETVAESRNPWSGSREKPVFGEEGMSRRRYSLNYFSDDIFGGNESLSSSPRKYEMKNPFAAGSQPWSPARPLPPKAEPFGSSFPAQFSLPAKLNKGINLPTFGSTSESKELSSGREEAINLAKYDETEAKGNSKYDSNGSEISKNGSRFHFSIYKWANKGSVTLAIPLRGSGRLKEKDKLQRCSSANEWITCESTAKEAKEKLHNSSCSIDRMPSNGKSFRVELDKNENGSIPKSESEIISRLRSTDKNISGDTVLHSSGGEEKTHCPLPQVNFSDKREKEVSAVGKETHKPQPKPPNLLSDNDNNEQGNDEIARNAGTKEISEKSVKKLSEILDSKNIKKRHEKKKAASNNVDSGETSMKQSPRNSWNNGNGRVRGKVKEFIKIFSQGASSKPRTDTVLFESHSLRRRERDAVKPENESSISMTERDEKIHMPNMQKKKSSPDIPVANHMSNGESEKSNNSSVKYTVSDGFRAIVEDPAESFEDNFLIKDLTPEERILPQFGIDPEEIKAIDAKIRQWSNGKQGNIRSLLSTLQYVLWPDSGWKPVPLVDIIEGPAVKRSYQKALLCLHPDKLQQKGAASDKKYIAEKIFDILQDAWTHFNSLGSL